MLAELQQPAREANMLVLSRKKDEQLVIRLGEETVMVRVLDVNGSRVRIGITAPRSVAVLRAEVARRDQETQEAAAPGNTPEAVAS
jgi:carbon storage regulator